jgi:hypothetical protein
VHLGHQGLDRLEALLGADAVDEADLGGLVVEVAVEVEVKSVVGFAGVDLRVGGQRHQFQHPTVLHLIGRQVRALADREKLAGVLQLLAAQTPSFVLGWRFLQGRRQLRDQRRAQAAPEGERQVGAALRRRAVRHGGDGDDALALAARGFPQCFCIDRRIKPAH